MRKRVILAYNRLLEEKLREANGVIKALNEEISVLKDEISLLSKPSELTEITLPLDFPCDNCATEEEETLDVDLSKVFDETENAEKETPADNGFVINDGFDMGETFDSVLNFDTDSNNDNEEYAVSLVAKIILESTKAELRVSCSNLASAADDKNTILGAAETAKQRIFEILKDNTPATQIKEALDAVVDSYLQKVKEVLAKY